MDDEILYQGPGHTVARTFVATTLVPYGLELRSDGDVNHGWTDLRDHAERVDDIPEARRSEGLAAILRVVAEPGSPLMSSACECGAFEHLGGGERPRWQVGGFVTMMFHDGDRNADPKNLVELAESVLSGIAGSAEHHIGFELIVEPLKAFFGRTDCHALMVKPLGYGPDEAAAWASFDYAAGAVARSLARRLDRVGGDPTNLR